MGNNKQKPEIKKQEQEQEQNNEVKLPFDFSFDKVENKSFCNIKSGNKEILNPTSIAIVFYGFICKIPKLDTVNDFDELWFRVTYLRSIGFVYYDGEGVLHSLEPIYSDIVNHKNATVEVDYMERKKWMNYVIGMVINLIRNKAELSKSKIPYEDFMDLRERTMQEFIMQNQ